MKASELVGASIGAMCTSFCSLAMVTIIVAIFLGPVKSGYDYAANNYMVGFTTSLSYLLSSSRASAHIKEAMKCYNTPKTWCFLESNYRFNAESQRH